MKAGGYIRTPEFRERMSALHKGKHHHTEEAKKKMSEERKGKKPLCSFRGRKHTKETKRKMSRWHMGKKCTKAMKEKVSEANKGRLAGSKNPKWNGGVSDYYKLNKAERQWLKLRLKILERDNYTCQRCGATNVLLSVHHIVPWKVSHDDSPDNLITECNSCHKILDAKRVKKEQQSDSHRLHR